MRGSTTGLTTGTGALVDTYTYDVFGASRTRTGSSPNEFTFTGEQIDSTGLQYLRARYYDPATGRLISRDPLPFVQRYAYVANSPTNLVDPSGLCVLCLPDPREIPDILVGMLLEGRLPLRIPGTPIDVHVSYQLGLTCALYPEACVAGSAAAGEASAMTWLIFKDYNPPEGTKDRPKEGDAFIHCYWSGLTTLAVGARRAEKVTSRFEAYGEENNKFQREYDIINNKRGRDFAQLARTAPGGRAALLSYCLSGS